MLKHSLAVIFIVIHSLSFGQTTTYKDALQYYNTEKNFNGVLLVATNGQIDYLDAAGISSRQSGTFINSKSKFKIASITKTFTAVLILQLMELGKLDLQATIGKYLPAYKGDGRNKVTIENLLTYSSGIPNCESLTGDDIYTMPISLDSFIAKYCSGKLENDPGSTFSYSNGDYIILGKIIEVITGKSYEQNLYEKILNPLAMGSTGMLAVKDIVSGLVQSYTYNDSLKRFNSDKPFYIENFFAAGAMYSTAEDLLKFDQGIFTYKLLKKQTADLMIKPHPKLQNVGLGFWSAEKYGMLNSRFVYRPGGIYGSASNWIHVIDSNRTIIALSNTNATDLFGLSQQLNGIATKQKTNIPATQNKITAPVAELANAEGTWIVDLRPAPNSEAYLKDFVINLTADKSFSGEFYGTPFATGKFNTAWDYLYFAFTTSDKENVYYHSGYIDGNKIVGISYSSGRNFISHWQGTKKTD